MNQTEAFKLMMREKEALIAEKYQLTDKVNTLRKQAKAAEEKWQKEKESLEKNVSEKASALDEMKAKRDQLQSEITRLKVPYWRTWLAGPPQLGPSIGTVRVVHPSVCVSRMNISENQRDRAMVTINRELKIRVPDSESAIRFATGSIGFCHFSVFRLKFQGPLFQKLSLIIAGRSHRGQDDSLLVHRPY